jgi:6-phosphogluconolactonase
LKEMTMSGKLQIHIQKSHEELALATAERMAESLAHAIKERGTGSLVLSGGETPRRAYEHLGSQPLSASLDWNLVHLYFGDERMVPPNHADSNYGMARRELIDRVPIPHKNVHRMKGELTPEKAAEEYDADLQQTYGEEIPRFDCILLGIGDDGHTASLFPGTDALNERKKRVTHLFVPRLNAWRVTLTFPVINNAREIIFLAEGRKKASIIRKVIEHSAPSPALPSSMIRPYDGELHWMLETEAASGIQPPKG